MSHLTLHYYQDGMVQLQSIDQSVNQRSNKQAQLSMLPQWGQTLYQVAFLFKIILSLMKVLCRNIWNYNKASLFVNYLKYLITWFGYHPGSGWDLLKVRQGPSGVRWGSVGGPPGVRRGSVWGLQAQRDPEQLVPAGQAEQGPPFLYIDFPIQFPPGKKKSRFKLIRYPWIFIRQVQNAPFLI